MKYIVSRKAAETLGVHSNTLRKWAKEGKIEFITAASGQRRYNVDGYLGTAKQLETVCYCRVSSYKQKDDLERQVEFMSEKYPDARIVKDIGSGLGFKRKGLLSILESACSGDSISLVVAYKDRLARWGYDIIKWIVERSGGKIVVLNRIELSPESELTNDLLSILHVFSCRMHGLRSYKLKIAKDFTDKGTKKDIQSMD